MRGIGTRSGNARWWALAALLAVAGLLLYRFASRMSYERSRAAAEAAIAERDFEAAGKHLDDCLSIRSEDPVLHLLAARTARRRGDFKTAARELKVCESVRDLERDCRLERQLTDIQLGFDRTAAERLLTQTLAAPRSPETELVLEAAIPQVIVRSQEVYLAGQSLVEGPGAALRTTIESAIALWLELRATPAHEAEGLYWRGRVRSFTDLQAATGEFRLALERNPAHFEARLHLAETLSESDPREAVEHLEQLRARNPDRVVVRLMLAHVRRGLGQLDAAQQLLDEILESEPKHAATLLERGKLALDAGRFEESIAFLQRARQALSNEPFVLLALSRAFHLAGRESEAAALETQYSSMESQRLKSEKARSEESRLLWRKRVEAELLRKP